MARYTVRLVFETEVVAIDSDDANERACLKFEEGNVKPQDMDIEVTLVPRKRKD